MPTIKQKRAFKEVTENHRSVSAAMRIAGYDHSTATKPKNLTETKGWKELMTTYLDDEKLAEKHHQLLNATSLERLNFDEKDSDEVVRAVVSKMPGYELLHIVESKGRDGGVISKYAYVQAPDSMAQDKALDKAYKLKGSYAPEKKASLNLNVNESIDHAEMDALRIEYEEKLRLKNTYG